MFRVFNSFDDNVKLKLSVSKDGTISATLDGDLVFTVYSSVLIEDTVQSIDNQIFGCFLSDLLTDHDYSTRVESLLGERDFEIESLMRGQAWDYMTMCLDLSQEVFRDSFGNIDLNKLAKNTAYYLDNSSWVNDPDHWIFDLAQEVVKEYNI